MLTGKYIIVFQVQYHYFTKYSALKFPYDLYIENMHLDLVEERVGDKQFSSLGLVMHSQGGGLVICGGKDKEKVKNY